MIKFDILYINKKIFSGNEDNKFINNHIIYNIKYYIYIIILLFKVTNY